MAYHKRFAHVAGDLFADLELHSRAGHDLRPLETSGKMLHSKGRQKAASSRKSRSALWQVLPNSCARNHLKPSQVNLGALKNGHIWLRTAAMWGRSDMSPVQSCVNVPRATEITAQPRPKTFGKAIERSEA